uniref:NADH dehydrogenase subunit 4 n=1 Tax=Navicula tsukamotoi TaxID=2018706 RepID=UPI00202852C0|nr:NADH dehydrogenase subunit 4 [Navicula tsukamotoi]QYB23120.1 NADH dehydrogenase subunit 4 [Navicula tsukamotoi]
MNINLLALVSVLPLFGSFILVLVPRNSLNLLKLIALNFSSLPFIGSLLIWASYKKSLCQFQFVTKLLLLPALNLNLTLGIDGISLFFLLLTTLLIPICILLSWDSVKKDLKEYLLAFLLLEFFLILVFGILDLLLFYIFFESVLIPMFLIVGIWGSRERKILASFYFFLYTLFGSVIMLLAIVYIYYQVGTTDYEMLLTFSFSELEQKFLWFAFFLAFAGKVPMVPVHLWLPEAHVEAPTAGSVILAGVLLKLGTYGLIRYSLPLFPNASFFFTPFVYTIAVVGIIYTSFTAIRQSDFKRIIAYTSIAHMNLVILGIFSFNSIGLEGAIFQSLSHGFVASALFLVIGIVYDRYHTRIVKYYSGLASVMPIYISIFLFFTMANISFPGTSSFIGEFLILTGSFKCSTVVTFLGATGVILGGAYSLWLLNRIAFGNMKVQYCAKFLDLNKREFVCFLPLILGTLFLGILPNIVLSSIHNSVNCLIELIYF